MSKDEVEGESVVKECKKGENRSLGTVSGTTTSKSVDDARTLLKAERINFGFRILENVFRERRVSILNSTFNHWRIQTCAQIAAKRKAESEELLQKAAELESIKLCLLEKGISLEDLITGSRVNVISKPIESDSSSLKLKDIEKYKPFFKMLKMNVPRAAIEQKMQMAGLSAEDIEVLDRDPESIFSCKLENHENCTVGTKLKDSEKYGKFFKMLKMNIPRPAVENKMLMAGLSNFSVLDKDPDDFLDDDCEFKEETTNNEDHSNQKLKDTDEFRKYFKMLKMNIPRQAVENKMRMAGFTDFSILDKDPESVLLASPSTVSCNTEQRPRIVREKLKDTEKYGKFFKMLKMSIPRPAVENQMKMAGLDNFSILDKDPDSVYASDNEVDSPFQLTEKHVSTGGVKLKDSEKYGKYFKMLKMNIPRPAVENKMRMAGLDDFSVLDRDPNSFYTSDSEVDGPSELTERHVSIGGVQLKDSEKYGKFFKMLKMNIPRPAVENKMRMAGLDDFSVLDRDPDSVYISDNEVDSSFQLTERHVPAGGVKLKDSEKYGKFFKMLKMNIPRPAVENKMRMAGLSDFSVLDKDPDSAYTSDAHAFDPTVQLEVKLKDHDVYGKFFKMLRMNIPRPAVENKMRMAGISDVTILDCDPESVYKPLENEAAEKKGESSVKLKDSAKYGKFFKMLKMNIPRTAVENKMRMAGISDFSVLNKDPESLYDENEAENSKSSSSKNKVKLKDTQKYGKFFKMLKMNIPRQAVENKMRMAGLTPTEVTFLSQDPETEIDETIEADTVNTKSFPGTTKASIPLKGLATPKKPPKVAQEKEKLMRRKLHWKIIPTSVLEAKSTVWTKMKKFDLEETDKITLNKLFTCKVENTAIKTPKFGGKSSVKKPSAPVLLEMQRSNNISIVLSRLSAINGKSIQRALITLEIPDQVSEEEFLGVLGMTPTDQEEKKLSAFKGDRTKLGKPEQYFFSLMDLKRYKQKLNIFTFKLNVESKFDSLKADLTTVYDTCQHLLQSEKFAKILNLLLTAGNLINGNTDNKKKVKGFSLETLLKLNTTKSFVGKTTVLGFIASLFSEKHRELLGYINSQLDTLTAASIIPLSFVLGEVKQLDNHFKSVEMEYLKLSKAIKREKEKAEALKKSSAIASEAETASAFSNPSSWSKTSTGVTSKSEDVQQNLLTPKPLRQANEVALAVSATLPNPRPKLVAGDAQSPIPNTPQKSLLQSIQAHHSKAQEKEPSVEAPIKSSGGLFGGAAFKLKSNGLNSKPILRKTIKDPYDTISREDRLFYSSLKKLYLDAQASLEELRPLVENAESSFKEVLEFYCEDSSTTAEKFYSTIVNFMKEVKQAVKDSDQARAREIKRQREKSLKEQKLEQQRSKRLSSKKAPTKAKVKLMRSEKSRHLCDQGFTRSGTHYGKSDDDKVQDITNPRPLASSPKAKALEDFNPTPKAERKLLDVKQKVPGWIEPTVPDNDL